MFLTKTQASTEITSSSSIPILNTRDVRPSRFESSASNDTETNISLRTFTLIVFGHPGRASLLRTQISCRNGATSFIERAHGGRFVGKYSTFGQNDNFAWILRFKEVGDPHFFLDTSSFLTNFC